MKRNPETIKTSYYLYSDSKLLAAEAYGLGYQVDKVTYDSLKKGGIDLEKRSGEAHRKLPHPAAFLIDKEGVISFAHVDPNYRVRLSNEAIMEAARKLVK